MVSSDFVTSMLTTPLRVGSTVSLQGLVRLTDVDVTMAEQEEKEEEEEGLLLSGIPIQGHRVAEDAAVAQKKDT